MPSERTSARGRFVARNLTQQPLFWEGLALAFALAWYQLAFRAVAFPLVTLPIEALSRPRGDLPWLFGLAAMVVVCTLAAITGLRTHLGPLSGTAASTASGRTALGRAPANDGGSARPDAIALASALACAAGTAFMYLAPHNAVLPYAGGMVAGAGFALLAIRLTTLAPRPRSIKSLFDAGCAALVVAQALQTIILFAHPILLDAVLCLAPIAAAGFLHKARQAARKEADAAPPRASGAQEYQLRSHLTVIALCFLGLGVYMGIIGFANDSRTPDEYLSWQFSTTVPGCLIACTVLWFTARASIEGPYVVSPIMLGTAALVLLLTVMSGEQGYGSSLGEALAHATGRATDGLLFVTAACTMIELAQAGNSRRLYSPAALLGLSACALLAGIIAGGVMMSLVGLSVLSTTLVAVFLLYGALLSLGLSVQQRSRESYVVVRNSLDVEKIANAQARALSEELGTLTAREAEVLPYLLQHLSIDAIAERLGVSRNTVKSHVAHIYEKAGVNARQQLIDLASAKVINL